MAHLGGFQLLLEVGTVDVQVVACFNVLDKQTGLPISLEIVALHAWATGRTLPLLSLLGFVDLLCKTIAEDRQIPVVMLLAQRLQDRGIVHVIGDLHIKECTSILGPQLTTKPCCYAHSIRKPKPDIPFLSWVLQ